MAFWRLRFSGYGGGKVFKLGTGELILILVIILLLFGAAQLPKIARSFGRSIKEFKKGSKEADEDSGEKPDNSNQ